MQEKHRRNGFARLLELYTGIEEWKAGCVVFFNQLTSLSSLLLPKMLSGVSTWLTREDSNGYKNEMVLTNVTPFAKYYILHWVE